MRILFLDDRVPHPRLGCGYPRTAQLLHSLTDSGFHVTYFPMQLRERSTRHYGTFAGAEIVLDPDIKLRHYLRMYGQGLDCVIISRPHNFKRSRALIARHAPNAAVLYDAEALFASRTIQRRALDGVPLTEEQAAKIVRGELRLIGHADAAIAVSTREALMMRSHSRGPVHAYSYAVAPRRNTPGWSRRKDILFAGSFLSRASSNLDTVGFLIERVMPAVVDRTTCRLRVAGTHSAQALAGREGARVRIEGEVEDLSRLHDECRVFAAPARYGAGIPLKVLEAMAAGIPCVISDILADQLDAPDGSPFLVATDPAEFAERVSALYRDENLWNRTRAAAWEYIARHNDPAAMKCRLAEIVRQTVEQRKARALPVPGLFSRLSQRLSHAVISFLA